MKKILVSLVIGVALCVVGVNDTFAAAIELNSTPLISDANLVSYYRLENVNDSKGANNLTNNNTATFTAGKFNNAGTFVRASNQFLSNSDAANLRINTSQSWVAWINMASYPGGSQISQIAGICPVGLANYRLWDVYNKRLRIQLSGLSAGSTAGSDLSLNTWYHVAWVYDSAGSTLTLYINGVPETPVAVTGTLTTATGDFNIGKSCTGATDPFDGKIDDVAVFNRALTDAEISNLYNGTWNAPPTAF